MLKHNATTLTVIDEEGSSKSIITAHPAPYVGNRIGISVNVEIVSFAAILEPSRVYPPLSTWSPGSQKANAPIPPVSPGSEVDEFLTTYTFVVFS